MHCKGMTRVNVGKLTLTSVYLVVGAVTVDKGVNLPLNEHRATCHESVIYIREAISK